MPVSTQYAFSPSFIETASFESSSALSSSRSLDGYRPQSIPQNTAGACTSTRIGLSMPVAAQVLSFSKVATALSPRQTARSSSPPGQPRDRNHPSQPRRSSSFLRKIFASPPYFFTIASGQSAHKSGYMVLLPLYFFHLFVFLFIFNLSFQAVIRDISCQHGMLSLFTGSCRPGSSVQEHAERRRFIL